MYFPIAGVAVNPLFLGLVGFVIGVLGFFGVGGGFLAGPMMFMLGVPMNFVVGTDLSHIAGNSAIATRRHWSLGHIDFRLGILMIAGTVPGVELGAQIIEHLKRAYAMDQVIGGVYSSCSWLLVPSWPRKAGRQFVTNSRPPTGRSRSDGASERRVPFACLL